MERVIFPVHAICEYLTPESKLNILLETEQDAQGSKVFYVVYASFYFTHSLSVLSWSYGWLMHATQKTSK